MEKISDNGTDGARTVSANDTEKPPPIDPMAEMFGPGSGVFPSPEDDSSAPEELLTIFEEFGIGEYAYRCILKEVTQGANNTHIRSFNGNYPSIEWITNNCGPGEYLLVFMWRQASDMEVEHRTGRKRMVNKSQQCRITISEKAIDQWREYQLKQKLRKLKEKRQVIQDAKLDRALDVDLGDLDPNDRDVSRNVSTDVINPATAGKEYVQNIIEAANMLGLTKKESSFSFEKILAIVAPLLPALLEYVNKSSERAQMQQQQFMTLLMTTMSGNTKELIEIMKANAGQGAGTRAVEEFKSMLTGAIDIKQELSGMGKESTADKVFKLIEGVSAHVIPLLLMPRAQAAADPRMKIAQAYMQNSPDVAELRNNPVELSKLVHDLDEYFGWEQTNLILQVAKLVRPEDCPMLPEQRYSYGDMRNAANDEETLRATSVLSRNVSTNAEQQENAEEIVME
jgi:hypothetical protein